MTHPYKPDGYNSLSPYLVLSDAAGTLRFLEAVLGAQVAFCLPAEDGRIRHAELRVDDSILMLADGLPEWPAQPAHVHVYVPDVDAAYERALTAGAVAIQPPTRKDDADRRCGVRDGGGTTWWLASRQG